MRSPSFPCLKYDSNCKIDTINLGFASGMLKIVFFCITTEENYVQCRVQFIYSVDVMLRSKINFAEISIENGHYLVANFVFSVVSFENITIGSTK